MKKVDVERLGICQIIDEKDDMPAPKKRKVVWTLIRRIAVLRQCGPYTTELTASSFYDNPPQYDVRRWHRPKSGYAIPSKHGIQLSEAELLALRNALIEEFPLN